jgi:hypothetical protein
MKNRFILLAAISLLLMAVLGCSWINPFSGSSETPKTVDSKTTEEKSTSDKAIESVIVEKTGIPECDELRDYISELAKSKDDNYVTKATREFFLNRISESIRKNIEENKDKPEELAKNCKEYKTQLETFKKDEDSKKEEK